MAQLDVLISLAKASKQMPVRCLPSFTQGGISIKNGYHPNLLTVKADIVANSITMSEGQRLLLLTGPNMGGKSTFLKQVLVLAILAQIGSFVPAL
jgi:DNA mismatch repair protein MutS